MQLVCSLAGRAGRWRRAPDRRIEPSNMPDTHLANLLGCLDARCTNGSLRLAELIERPAELVAALARLAAGQQERLAQLGDADKVRETAHSSQHLLAILDNAPAVIYVKDTAGRYRLINRRYEELFPVSRLDVVGKTDYDIFPARQAEAFRRNDAEVLHIGQAIQFEEVAPHADGLHTYLSLKFPLLAPDGTPEALCGISTDITDRKRAEDQLRIEQRWLKRLLDLQEHERQLLTYEIHDGPVQYVTGALMRLEALREAEYEEFEPVLILLRRTIEELRRMISGLRPPVLDELGPVAAIEHLINDCQRDDLRVTFVHDVETARLDSLVESALFRIAQEALTNVIRHSRCNRARVELTQADGRLRLTVRDWGVGFLPDREREQTFGLEGIRERARLLGGQASIESQPDAGTLVVVELPIHGPQAEETTA
jgi:PAS domain S-box-containing protein